MEVFTSASVRRRCGVTNLDLHPRVGKTKKRERGVTGPGLEWEISRHLHHLV
jgi:hypothetical protein